MNCVCDTEMHWATHKLPAPLHSDAYNSRQIDLCRSLLSLSALESGSEHSWITPIVLAILLWDFKDVLKKTPFLG